VSTRSIKKIDPKTNDHIRIIDNWLISGLSNMVIDSGGGKSKKSCTSSVGACVAGLKTPRLPKVLFHKTDS
jgi:hypothetical protein